MNIKSFLEENLLNRDGSALKTNEIAEIYKFFGQTLRDNCQFKIALEFLHVSVQIWSKSDRDLCNVLCELEITYCQLTEYDKSKDYH